MLTLIIWLDLSKDLGSLHIGVELIAIEIKPQPQVTQLMRRRSGAKPPHIQRFPIVSLYRALLYTRRERYPLIVHAVRVTALFILGQVGTRFFCYLSLSGLLCVIVYLTGESM